MQLPAVANALGTETRGTLYDSPSQVDNQLPPQRYPLGRGVTPITLNKMC